MEHTSPIEFTYAPPVASRRRFVRRLVQVLCLIAAGVAGYLLGPTVIDRASMLYLQRQCLAGPIQADTVVYESDPSRAQQLVLNDSAYHQNRGGIEAVRFDRRWETFYASFSPPGRQPGATLFMQTRNRPADHVQRLVTIEAMPHGPAQGRLLSITVTALGTWLTPPRVVYSSGSIFQTGDEPLRFFAGSADPGDPSHFEIRYQIGEQPREVIDGWLQAGDAVVLENRPSSSP